MFATDSPQAVANISLHSEDMEETGADSDALNAPCAVSASIP